MDQKCSKSQRIHFLRSICWDRWFSSHNRKIVTNLDDPVSFPPKKTSFASLYTRKTTERNQRDHSNSYYPKGHVFLLFLKIWKKLLTEVLLDTTIIQIMNFFPEMPTVSTFVLIWKKIYTSEILRYGKTTKAESSMSMEDEPAEEIANYAKHEGGNSSGSFSTSASIIRSLTYGR